MENINNGRCDYANTEFILLSLIDNKIGIISNIRIEIIRYIKYIHIIKKIILINDDEQYLKNIVVNNWYLKNNNRNIENIIINSWNIKNDIQQNFVSYFTWTDHVKNHFFGNDKDIFDGLIIKHKCTMTLIYKSFFYDYNEAVIYVPDLFPIHESDPILNDLKDMRLNDIFSNDWCENFVIKNPIMNQLQKCIHNKITLQIYKCNHPVLNLLLSNNYVQCGVMECENYYITGFLRYDSTKINRVPKVNGEKVTLITPKKKNIEHEPICEITKKFIIAMQNIETERNSKYQRKKYNLNFHVLEFLI